MGKGITIGLLLLVTGIVIWIAYGLYIGFDEILSALNLVTGAVSGLIILGIVVLIVSVVIEQRKDTKEIESKLKKEDLEP